MTSRPITVVIPVLNGEATIARQISALAEQRSAPPFEIVLVDNGCVDRTVEFATCAAAEVVPLRVVNERNRGVNCARNAGIAAASDGVVLLCDADDEVTSGWVAALASAVDEGHWAAGGVDYRSLNDDATLAAWGCPASAVPEVTSPYIDRTFGGSCAFLHSMWESVGGFDPRLSGPTDENEFFMRAYAAGFRPRVVPEALVAYRLRAGAASWRRTRYLSGRGQGIAAGCAGGTHLLPLCRPTRSTWRLVKLAGALPKYMWSPASRREWIGGVLRQWGRLVGWFSASGRAVRASARSASAPGGATPRPGR